MSEKKVSSGAKKAEKLTNNSKNYAIENRKDEALLNKKTEENEVPALDTKTVKSKTAAKTKAKNKTEKGKTKDKGKNVTKHEAKAQRKLEAQKIRAEKKAKRQERRLEHKQKAADRIAAFKNKAAERKEKRRERKDRLKNETRAMRIERKKEERIAKTEARKAKREARLNAKIARREHALKVRAEKSKNKQNRQRTPGFGGWLAAVIALGVTTLALGTMLTFGWMNYNGVQADLASDGAHSLYELNAIVDNLDANLAKARVSYSAGEQAMILTDVAIESELAESTLENLPVAGELTRSITSFINKMGESAKSMLYSVASGKELTDSQIATIEYMYSANKEVKEILNSLTGNMNEKQMLQALTKHGGIMFDSFDKLNNISVEVPKEIYDGPFAEQTDKVSAKTLEGAEEITPSACEELARKYFADYDLKDVKCTGEAAAKGLTLYNVSLYTDDGEYFAQLSKAGGKVVLFDSFKECSKNNFDVDNCITIAQNFLEKIGFENMQPVWVSESGTTCNLNFAYAQDGTIIYPDMVKVKVCEERGIVTGAEAISYVLNHTERQLPEAAISLDEAQSNLNQNINVKATRLCVIPKNGEEKLAYEFYGNLGEDTYYIYVDAQNGMNLDVFTVIGTAQGKALM